MQFHENPLENFIIFKEVAYFLSISELFITMTLNRLFFNNGIKYIKIILREQNLLKNIDLKYFNYRHKGKSLKQNNEQEGEQNDNNPFPYNLLYKHFYGRETLLAPLLQGSDRDKMQECFKPFRRTHTYGYGVKEFKIGQKFTGFLTHSNELYFCTSQDYIDKVFPKPQFIRKASVKKFSVIGKNQLIYLTQSGELYFIFINHDTGEIQEKIVPITQNIPVIDFDNSYFFLVLIFDIKDKIKDIISVYNHQVNQLVFSSQSQQSIEQQSPPQQQIEENIIGLVLFINDIQPIALEQGQRYRKILGYPYSTVLSLITGSQNFYLLGVDGKVYQSDQQNSVNANNNPLMVFDNQIQIPSNRVFPNEFFTNKHIVSLYSGMQYFFAIGREVVQPIREWSNSQLVKWMDECGFDDYSRIVKYNEWSGEEFTNLTRDKQFMKETLGLTRDDLYTKMMTVINNALTPTPKEQQLYGWGKNEFGQLGTQMSSNIPMAYLINLPKMLKDEIVKIECGSKNSVILTKAGNIYITEVQQKLVKVQEVVPKQEEEKKIGSKGYGKVKQGIEKYERGNEANTQSRKKSKNVDVKEQQSPLQQEKTRWIDITQVFTKLKDSREYEKLDIALSKDYIAVTCVSVKNQYLKDLRSINEGRAKIKDKNDEIKKPFKTGSQILDRILWDPALNKNDFIVGYEDRFLGILEIPVNEYEGSEVKSHRIQYFKQNNIIIWDRKQRINNLNE